MMISKTTGMGGGIHTGGDDSGSALMPGLSVLGVDVRGNGDQHVLIPKGAVLVGILIVPDVDNPAAAGNVTFGTDSNPVLYRDATSLTAFSAAALTPVVQLGADTQVLFRVSDHTTGAAKVGLRLWMPLPRR